ncbi:MAG: sigma-70 family RNA polymerase sigma factor [Gemmatimonadota bacterium]|nr:MAG: sigma-70 family RNA polymerase sigma factor [Gemmatimonadota bacterium]
MTGSQPFDEVFREEFERHFATLYRYVDRLSGDPDMAADIAQEAFIRLYQRRALPVDTGSWLAVVARNLFHNARSKSKRRSRLLAREEPRQLTGYASMSPETDLEDARRRKAVRLALDSLPAREREMLVLRYEGYTYREIAQIVDVNPASVGTLLVRAKEAFRRALEDGHDATPR